MVFLQLIGIVLLVAVFGDCYHSPLFIPCKKGDSECVTKSTRYTMSKLVPGIPELGVETSKILFQKEIVGEYNLKYKFSEITTNGMDNCEVSHVKLDIDGSCFDLELLCPNLTLKGQYMMKGNILGLCVDEEGTFVVTCHKYKLGIKTKISEERTDKKNHLAIKSFTTYANLEDRVIFALQNTKGTKDLENTANDNWKQIVDMFQDSFIDGNVKLLIKNANKFLASIPVDELFKNAH